MIAIYLLLRKKYFLMKRRIRLTESGLHKLIGRCVRAYLNEAKGEKDIDREWAKYGIENAARSLTKDDVGMDINADWIPQKDGTCNIYNEYRFCDTPDDDDADCQTLGWEQSEDDDEYMGNIEINGRDGWPKSTKKLTKFSDDLQKSLKRDQMDYMWNGRNGNSEDKDIDQMLMWDEHEGKLEESVRRAIKKLKRGWFRN